MKIIILIFLFGISCIGLGYGWRMTQIEPSINARIERIEKDRRTLNMRLVALETIEKGRSRTSDREIRRRTPAPTTKKNVEGRSTPDIPISVEMRKSD